VYVLYHPPKCVTKVGNMHRTKYLWHVRITIATNEQW